MTLAINTTAAYAAFDKFAGAMDGARGTLVKALGKAGITTLEEARPVAMQWVSARTKCPMVSGSGKGTGRMVLKRGHPKYEAARKSLQRVMEAFAPKKPKESKAKTGTPTANKADAVKDLLARYEALSRAEKARFLAEI
jgi:hypothetical protein